MPFERPFSFCCAGVLLQGILCVSCATPSASNAGNTGSESIELKSRGEQSIESERLRSQKTVVDENGDFAFQPQDVFSGTVIATLQAGGYTYAHLSVQTQKIWVALPQGIFYEGQSVQVQVSVVMTHFYSKSLDRTFDSIVFGTLSTVDEPSAIPRPQSTVHEL